MSVYLTPSRLPLFVGNRDQRTRAATSAPASAGIAFVQAATANSGAAEPGTLDVVLSAATAGNLLVVAANSDSTLTAPAGFSTAASAVNAQGCYLFYKIAAGGETTLTVTVNVARPVAAVACEYSGITGVSPVDQTVTSTDTGGAGVGPVSAGTTGATSQAVELAVAVTGPHSFGAGVGPASAVWGGGYTARGEAKSAFGTDARNSAVFLSDLILAATGTQSTTCSWTNSAQDHGSILATFKGA